MNATAKQFLCDCDIANNASPKGSLREADSESENHGSESLSDVSSDSDMFHVCVDDRKMCTEQDQELNRIEALATRLRRRPLLPPDPADAMHDWTDVVAGIKLPSCHCAFADCAWTSARQDTETCMKTYRRDKHLRDLGEACDWETGREHTRDVMAYYCAAIRVQEQQKMPNIGVSVDRRTFGHVCHAYSSDRIRSLVCFVCCQTKTDTESNCAESDVASKQNDIVQVWGLAARARQT